MGREEDYGDQAEYDRQDQENRDFADDEFMDDYRKQGEDLKKEAGK